MLIAAAKRIAVVAHDNKKQGTAPTRAHRLFSGPLGGDQQIGVPDYEGYAERRVDPTAAEEH